MKIVLIFLVLLVAVFASVNINGKQCIEKTTKLSCADFSVMYNAIEDAIRSIRPEPEIAQANPASNLLAGKIVAGIVRLVFHDAVEYDPTAKDNLRSDGCVNLNDLGNAGLNRVIPLVNSLWEPFCDKISRADFWYLAAKVAIETSTPYVDYENTLGEEGSKKKKRSVSVHPKISYFSIPFYYGRKSNDNCTYAGKSRLPSAEGTSNEFRRVFFNRLGLNVRETTALLGAHTLGSVSVQNSGYNGVWKGRTDLFDTEYFFQLVTNKWKPQILSSPAPGKLLSQWVIENATAENSNIIMLNTDMDLLYNIDPKETRQKRPMCGPYDPTSKTDGCPHIDKSYSNLDFNYYVLKYFEGHAINDQDLPGSARWLHDFARAFNKMCSAGYAKNELTCAECVTPTCEDCKRKHLCEGPHYGKFPSSSNDYEEKNDDDKK